MHKERFDEPGNHGWADEVRFDAGKKSGESEIPLGTGDILGTAYISPVFVMDSFVPGAVVRDDLPLE